MEVTGNIDKAIEIASRSDSMGMANIMLLCCFAFMVWQSWLQYKQKSRNDVEIENLKARADKNEETIKRMFQKIDEISANLSHIGGVIDTKFQNACKP